MLTERVRPNWVRCLEDVLCINCAFYLKHPDSNNTMEGFCKRKCDMELEVRWDNWCGEGKWVHQGHLISAEDASIYVRTREEVNKDKRVK
jgi:hypothetical protein